MNISFSTKISNESGALVVFALDGGNLGSEGSTYDKTTGGSISRAAGTGRFSGKATQIADVLAPANLGFSRVVVAGLGKAKDLTTLVAENVGAAVAAHLLRSGETNITVLAENFDGLGISEVEFGSHVAAGLKLRSYHFSKYKTKQPEAQKASLEGATIVASDDAAKAYEEMGKVLEGVFLTRDLVTEPANVIYPGSFADEIRKMEADGLEIEVLGEEEMTKLGMGALLAVGQGSARESHMVIMKWNGGKEGDAPLGLIGKGVTFDTGGISLKPGAGMEEMKWDMGGAGIVTGAMKALARRKAKANVVGLVGLVENMPSSTAQRPGDVVTSMSGQTIEVLNTDAEGRMVLADVLWYCQDRFKPKAMVNLATLTGAIIITLGRGQFAGLFSDNDGVANGLIAAGEKTGDRVWRLPVNDEYDKWINCDIADMKNMGDGPNGGSITAAQFLRRHTNGVPWAHIDVAGMVWTLKPGRVWDKGATGYGVRLLDQYVRDNYEG